MVEYNSLEEAIKLDQAGKFMVKAKNPDWKGKFEPFIANQDELKKKLKGNASEANDEVVLIENHQRIC